jgi:hypothetical protein
MSNTTIRVVFSNSAEVPYELLPKSVGDLQVGIHQRAWIKRKLSDSIDNVVGIELWALGLKLAHPDKLEGEVFWVQDLHESIIVSFVDLYRRLNPKSGWVVSFEKVAVHNDGNIEFEAL